MPDPTQTDTITAISTPPGRGGIGIIRLAGPEAITIATQLLQLTTPLDHQRARFTRILDPNQTDPNNPTQTIDDAIVTAFLAPHSYTGDDLVEIAAHGSPVVLASIIQSALEKGARLATPGEFTQRAFLSGRLDLTQAEAVHDLIAAQTLDQARTAAQQLGGALSRRVAPAKESLLHLIALLEAGMDFASGELDDVEIVPPNQIAAAITATQIPLQQLAESFRHGQLLRTGASLALVGRPNAGKSSLFNRLLNRDRAIVTPIPGTTRDTIEETLSLSGIPIRLIDTAGIRLAHESSTSTGPIDEAEAQGIQRSHQALADADLILLILDVTQPNQTTHLIPNLTHRPHLIIHNKIDLLPKTQNPKPKTPALQTYALETSALTGEGLDTLHAAILQALHAEGALADAGALNNLRQQQAITHTLTALTDAQLANTNALPHELILLDLHTALRALDSLTGQTTPDDILTRIFTTFCIGK